MLMVVETSALAPERPTRCLSVSNYRIVRYFVELQRQTGVLGSGGGAVCGEPIGSRQDWELLAFIDEKVFLGLVS